MRDPAFQFSTDPVTVLNGHISAETAYLVDDYPYGRVLRCKIRYWIETAEKGAKKGQQRFMSQTTNPKLAGDQWNKPKGGTYSGLVIMYLDAENGHVQGHHVDAWVNPEAHAWALMVGLVEQLDAKTRRTYDALARYSRFAKGNANRWPEFYGKVALLAEHIRTTGSEPELTNGVYTLPTGAMRHIGTPHVKVFMKLAREQGKRTTVERALEKAYTPAPASQVTCKHGRGLGDTCDGDPDTGECKQ